MPDVPPHILTSIYQLDNFITGPSNRMAYTAALRVAEEPGRLYNPLVIYGGVGLGKTHLLQAVGNAVAARNPQWSVVMLSGGQIKRQDLDGAERADLLLIDDLHLCIQEREIQIRMIPLFDAMVGTGRQIAATTDMPPQKMERLDAKLLSRLLGGVIVGLREVEASEKVMILAKKAEAHGLALSDEVLATIASRVPGNIRELEGALNRVMLYASLFEGQVTRAIVDEALPPSAPVMLAAAPAEAAVLAAEEPGGEFGAFVSGLDSKVSDLITQEQNAEKLRQEYREKLYIWRMKGFNTSRVEKTLEQDINAATREYEAFTNNIEKLIALQEEFGNMAPAASAEQVARIEALLFDPDQVAELASELQKLKQELVGKAKAATVAAESVTAEAPTEADEAPAAPAVPAPAAEMPEKALTNLGLIEDNWPRPEDRLMESF